MSPPTRYSLFPSTTPSTAPSAPSSPPRRAQDTSIQHDPSELSLDGRESTTSTTRLIEQQTLPADEISPISEPTQVEAAPHTIEADTQTEATVLKGRKKAPPASIPLDQPQTMRSMFPTYDTDRALNEQYYLPSQMSPSHIPMEALCKTPYSAAFDPEKSMMEKEAEKAGLVFKPVGSKSDNGFTPEWELPGMWALLDASAGRNVRQDYKLCMHQAQPSKTKRKSRFRKSMMPVSQRLLTFGASPVTPFMSVSTATAPISPDNGAMRTLYNVQKHGLNRFSHGLEDAFAPGNTLADFTLKQAETERMLSPVPQELQNGIEVITTFIPNKSTLRRATSGTPINEEGAAEDDTEDFQSTENERSRCYIVLRSYPGQRRPCYALKHPNLGFMRLKIDGDVRLDQYTAPVAGGSVPLVGKIQLLAPIRDDHFEDDAATLFSCATTTVVEPEIVLASLDLVASTLFVDGAAVADVNEPSLVETAISTLVAVLYAETGNPRLSQQLTFAPPPTGMELEKTRSRSFPLIGSRKPKKPSRKEKAEEEMVSCNFLRTMKKVAG